MAERNDDGLCDEVERVLKRSPVLAFVSEEIVSRVVGLFCPGRLLKVGYERGFNDGLRVSAMVRRYVREVQDLGENFFREQRPGGGVVVIDMRGAGPNVEEGDESEADLRAHMASFVRIVTQIRRRKQGLDADAVATRDEIEVLKRILVLKDRIGIPDEQLCDRGADYVRDARAFIEEGTVK